MTVQQEVRAAAAQAVKGTIWGVGLGPGDPELMSVRADRLLRGASHVAYFRKAGRPGQARRIVEGMLRPRVIETQKPSNRVRMTSAALQRISVECIWCTSQTAE